MTYTLVRRLLPVLATSAMLCAQEAVPEGSPVWWSTFRGPDGTGVAPASDPPVEWSEQKNIKWKVALPGLGSSSPIVVDDRIYLTTAVETDREGEKTEQAPAVEPQGRPGRRPGRRRNPPPSKIHEFVVLAFDRADGKLLWQTTVNECVPHEGRHNTGTFASSSCVIDDEHLYAFFGSRGLHCLDLSGKIKWSIDLGRQTVRGQFGEGASPAMHENTLIVPWDHEADSFLAAIDKRTGKELWRRDRDEKSNWSTPLIVEVDGKPQVIVTGLNASIAYDVKTGETIWQCTGMTQNCVPTPIHRDGTVWLMSGFRGACFQAVRPAGAKGDITNSDNLLWSYGKGTSYVPSALLYEDSLYFLRSNSAVLTCLDAGTGEPRYEELRLDGMRTIYSSPVGAAGRVYLTSREGATKVFAHGPEFKELATNQLDDEFDATAAIVGDEIYLRGAKNLYCIAAKR